VAEDSLLVLLHRQVKLLNVVEENLIFEVLHQVSHLLVQALDKQFPVPLSYEKALVLLPILESSSVVLRELLGSV